MKRQNSAFTLIELLVVISIIALLIGILLPALGAARDQGRQAVCMATLKQWALGTYNYSADNKGTLPCDGDDNPGWCAASTNNMTSCISRKDWWANAIPGYLNSDSLQKIAYTAATTGGRIPVAGSVNNMFICPSAQMPVAADFSGINLASKGLEFDSGAGATGPGYKMSTQKSSQTGATLVTTGPDGAAISTTGGTLENMRYFMNYVPNTKSKKFLTAKHDANSPVKCGPTALPEVSVKVDNVKWSPSECVFMVEMRTSNLELPAAFASTTAPDAFGGVKDFARCKADWQRFAARHNAGGNLTYLDGHAAYSTFKNAVTASDGGIYSKNVSTTYTTTYADGSTSGANNNPPSPMGNNFDYNKSGMYWDWFEKCSY